MLARAWSRYAIALLALAPAVALAAPIESQPAEVNGTPTATSRLWVTLDRTLEGGTNHIILVSSDEVPTDSGGSSGTDSGGGLDDTGGNSGIGGTTLGPGSNDGTGAGFDDGGSNDGGMYDEGCNCRADSAPRGAAGLGLVALLLPALRRRRAPTA